jgi:uncharacterized protein
MVKTDYKPITGRTTDIIVDDNSPILQAIDTILLKVASRCNIDCTYCYVFNMGDDAWKRLPKVMATDTIDAIAKALRDLSFWQKAPFSIVLHGGEPLLLGTHRLKLFLSKLRSVLGEEYPIGIQSNGILISNEILDICSQYRTTMAVSLDGPKTLNDVMRRGHQLEGTFDQVMRGYELLKTHADSSFLNTGFLAVIDPSSDPGDVYAFFKELGPPSVDFLYKDGNHSKLPLGKETIDSIEYGDWMLRLLNIYLQDKNPLPIRILDDMMKVILGGSVTKEGVGVTNFGILIVDTDGKIKKNDTLKSTFAGADTFDTEIDIKTDNLIDFIKSKEFKEYKQMQLPTAAKCNNCKELAVCGGGMTLHRWSEEQGYDNESIYCADQLHLITGIRKKIAQYLKHYG